ncbi:MAG: aldo/keto reductase [Alphaproteobacteria bacterium]|nr:aldo/keto reductase [Alphaproteobacteria bacterium]
MDKILMQTKALGKTGLHLPRLGLGTVKFGRNEGVKYPQSFELPDMDSLRELLALALDLGVNLLDTAPAYGQSEARLGELIKGNRKKWIIVSKAGEIFERGRSRFNFTAEHFSQSLEESLKRLGTDYLDVLLIHSDGRDLEILRDENLIMALHDFKKRGLVRAIGASTKTVKGGCAALDLLDCVMVTYNKLDQSEKPVLDYAVANGKGILLKKIFASGHMPLMQDRNPVQAAMRFVFSHPGVTSALIGTINPEHLQENAAALHAALALRSTPRHPPLDLVDGRESV